MQYELDDALGFLYVTDLADIERAEIAPPGLYDNNCHVVHVRTRSGGTHLIELGAGKALMESLEIHHACTSVVAQTKATKILMEGFERN